MIDYSWPATITPRNFQLRIVPAVLGFQSPYTKSPYTVDLMGDYWRAMMDMPNGTDPIVGGALEALFDRLKGPANTIAFHNFRRPAPLGTARGTLTLAASASQHANTASITGAAANATLLAGDMLSIGGQLVRVMADATANGSGVFASVEFAPRLRASKTSGAAVVWDKPTAKFILLSDGAPVQWMPGMYVGPSAEFREYF